MIDRNVERAGLATDLEVTTTTGPLPDVTPDEAPLDSRRLAAPRWLKDGSRPDGDDERAIGDSRWKILDNLRRSLVEIAQLAMLITGWFLLRAR